MKELLRRKRPTPLANRSCLLVSLLFTLCLSLSGQQMGLTGTCHPYGEVSQKAKRATNDAVPWPSIHTQNRIIMSVCPYINFHGSEHLFYASERYMDISMAMLYSAALGLLVTKMAPETLLSVEGPPRFQLPGSKGTGAAPHLLGTPPLWRMPHASPDPG